MIRRLLLVCCVAMACVAPVPRPSAPPTPRPPEAVTSNDPSATPLLPSNVETVALAQTMEAVSPRWGPTPDGPILLDEFGESQVVVGAGTHLIVTSDPQPGPDGTWVAAWVVASDSSWPSDYVAWFPASQRGRATIRSMPREGCPGVATIATIAPLLPEDRRRCVGSGDIAFEAKTWFPGATPGYDVDPVWFGSGSDLRGSVALFDAGLDPFGKNARRSTESGPYLDARTGPGVERPPEEMLVRIRGHFDDPASAACRREFRLNLGANRALQPGWGLPPEAPASSAEWCRNQFVVGSWDVVLGPEGRAIDPADPQLHRGAWLDDNPGVSACGGVGMELLRIRIDPTLPDPVWLDVGNRGGRSVPIFSSAFRMVVDEPPRIVSRSGIILADGEVVDGDHPKPGLAVCTEGQVVAFQQLGGT